MRLLGKYDSPPLTLPKPQSPEDAYAENVALHSDRFPGSNPKKTAENRHYLFTKVPPTVQVQSRGDPNAVGSGPGYIGEIEKAWLTAATPPPSMSFRSTLKNPDQGETTDSHRWNRSRDRYRMTEFFFLSLPIPQLVSQGFAIKPVPPT